MKRSLRKLAGVLAVVLLLSVTTIYAFASTNQTYFSQYISSGFTTLNSVRYKSDYSDVFIEINANSATDRYQVRTMGCNSDGGSAINCTRYNGQAVSYVTCRTGVSYSIESVVKERGGGYAVLNMASLGSGVTTSGYWAPDTAQSFTPAAP